MNLLRTERDTLDAYLPGLDKYLSEIPLLELEQPGSIFSLAAPPPASQPGPVDPRPR